MFHRPKTDDTSSGKNNNETTQNVQKNVSMSEEGVKSSQTQNMTSGAASGAGVSNPSEFYATANKEKSTMTNQDHTTEQDKNEVPAGIFQRAPGQTPQQLQRSMPNTAYTGGAMTGKAQSSTYDVHNGEERRMVIGQGITMSGEIQACDVLQVEGTLEAALKGARVVDIAETGTFFGSVEIEEATIAGRFEGEITVHGRLTIKSGGSVIGSISYKELEVEAGAMIDGKISPLAAGGAAQSGSIAKKTTARSNDNQGAELPFSGTSAIAAE